MPKPCPFTIVCLMIVALTCSACRCTAQNPPKEAAKDAPKEAPKDVRPFAERPFAGLSVVELPGVSKCRVADIMPGPLQGNYTNSPFMERGDDIVAVDGKALSAAELQARIKAGKSGDVLMLRVQHNRPNDDGSGLVPDEKKGLTEVKLVLSSLGVWSGPAKFPHPHPEMVDPDKVVPVKESPTPLEKLLAEQFKLHEMQEPVDRLFAYFKKIQDDRLGYNVLGRTAYPFYRPTRMAELQRRITDPLPQLAEHPELLMTLAAENLDVKLPAADVVEKINLTKPAEALASLAKVMAAADGHLQRAFAGIPAEQRAKLAADLDNLVEYVTTLHYVGETPEVQTQIQTMQASMKVDFGELLAAGDVVLKSAAHRNDDFKAPEAAPVELPVELKGAVTGDVLAVLKTEQGWLVYGGAGDNTYDMSKIAAVVDAGGNDTYNYPDAPRPVVQVVIDLGGSDLHRAQGVGPASATMGVSVLVDCGDGDDRYYGGRRSCGVGLMGVGVLLDYAGSDSYSGVNWSVGAAVYGVGAILDLGERQDRYQAEMLSQGVGGPRGFGLLFDEDGPDSYEVRRPDPRSGAHPFDYDFCQGIGFGFRWFDDGGIGVLCDLGGNDLYQGGSFCQGGGYFMGLGVLYDREGNDLYQGTHHCQGFGCHQGHGILADDSGDDIYWAAGFVTQGGSWDSGVGMLIDRSGDDVYRTGSVSQGGASMQGIAWLIDLQGTDRYVAAGEAGQGESWKNTFGFAATKCYSLSVFVDAGGTEDYYSTGRPNGKTLAPGHRDEANPGESFLYGLFIDTPKLLDLEPLPPPAKAPAKEQ